MPNLSSRRQDPILLALGAAIKRQRISQGISQEELALRADIDRSYLGRVERGDNNVAVLKLARIAQALNLTIAGLTAEAGI